MKELSIEEKAKLYDEALNRAKNWRNAPNSDKIPTYANRVIEEIFPELYEPDDEKIRKTIIRFFKDNYPNETQMYEGSVTVGKAIDWLEKQGEKDYTLSKEDVQALNRISAILVEASEVKNWWKEYRLIEKDEMFKLTDFLKSIKGRIQPTQGESNPYSGVSFKHDGHIWGMCARDNGVDILLDKQLFKHLEMQDEQKPTDKVEPKFKVGDWLVTDKGDTVQIEALKKSFYTIHNGMYFHMSYVDECWRKWTIEDAKDGDVLSKNDTSCIVLFKEFYYSEDYIGEIGDDIEGFKSYCHCREGVFNSTWVGWSCDSFHPATKEQRDLLFQKMKEEGYEWNAEKKVLENLKPKFKVGDWVAINPELRFASPLCIKDIDNNNYRVETINGESGTPKIDYLDNHYHLWSIQDAKEGDVLAYGDNPEGQHVSIIMLFKSVRTFNSVFNHFHIFNDEFRIDNWCDCGKTAHPATKEQRKTLFAKMKEEGYGWDADKKELIKL